MVLRHSRFPENVSALEGTDRLIILNIQIIIRIVIIIIMYNDNIMVIIIMIIIYV